MKNAILAGAIAGVVSGIICAIISFITISTRVFGIYGRSSNITNFVVAILLLTIIFGTIFSLMYSKLYGSIPGEGIRKGLSFGLMIWFIKDIVAGAYVILAMTQIAVGVDLIVGGLYMWTIYGLVLGYLYKK